MSKRLIPIVLFLIVLLGGLLRFYHITINPPGLNSDEVAIGYNAYSILKTGRDEYGQFLPLAFRSFDDYKPPLYIYLTIPSVAIFGPTEFAIRFPSAILGILAVLLTYFLAHELFNNKKIALLAAFLLAISPWHIQFTRTAYETGSQAFFSALALLLFLKSKQTPRYLIFSAVVFGIQTYLYQASRIFVPLVVGSVIAIYCLPNIKRAFVFGAVFSLVFLPNILVILSPNGMVRFRGTTLFADLQRQDDMVQVRRTDWLLNDNKSVVLYHSDMMTYFQPVLIAYLSHFRLDFLVGSDNNFKNTYAPGVGLLHVWELPFLLSGLYFLIQKKSKATLLILVWIFLVPIPAAVTQQTPSAVRTAAFLPMLQVITALGMTTLLVNRYLRFFTPVLIGIFVYEFSFYLHMLYIHAPTMFAKNWYQSHKAAVLETKKIAQNYDQVWVSTGLDEPQIFYLFYLHYDPSRYQLIDGGTVSGGFAEDRNRFDKYVFKPINWEVVNKLPKTLLVGYANEFPQEAHILKSLTYPNGATSIVFVDEQK